MGRRLGELEGEKHGKPGGRGGQSSRPMPG